MSMYPDYLKETHNREYVERPYGFCTYSILKDKSAYLGDTYVRPEFRGKQYSQELLKIVETIARNAGCVRIYTTVYSNLNNVEISIAAAISAGFKVNEQNEARILFCKEL